MDIVSVDIGGTHSRFAIAEVEGGRVVALGDPITLKTAEYASLQTAWQMFEKKLDRPAPRAAAIAVASPVTGDIIRLTNNPWVIRPSLIPERLGVDRIDIYLLHWEGSVPLEETVDAFQELVDEGMIARWGVSNLDLRTMERLVDIDGGNDCAANQLLYNLGSRGVEFDLLPWMQARDMPMMAYSPLGRGGLLEHPLIVDIANRHDASPAQVALAAVLRHDGVIAIPKASSVEHVEANADALDIRFDAEDLERLDHAFPPPTHETPLDVI
jgi:hypothetical protein